MSKIFACDEIIEDGNDGDSVGEPAIIALSEMSILFALEEIDKDTTAKTANIPEPKKKMGLIFLPIMVTTLRSGSTITADGIVEWFSGSGTNVATGM
jgi:hypothetical protein